MKMKYRLIKKKLLETLPCFLPAFVTHKPSFAMQASLQGFIMQSKWIPAAFIKACMLKIELGIGHPKRIISQSGIVDVSGFNQE